MDRVGKILDLLASGKTLKLTIVAELLGVSNVTLRKDLNSLEKHGIVCRSNGYVSLNSANDTGKRIAFNHLIKRKIAGAAVQTVEEGETVMLDSGSCCALFAEELAIAKKNITIITNSAFITNYVCHLPYVKIILLGGYFQPESQVLVGPITQKCADFFFADKFFLGTDGYIPDYGFTGRDHFRVETSLGLAKRAKKVFILTEAEKFLSRGVYNMLELDKITGVFTDDSIPKDAEAALIKSNIILHKVSAAEEKIVWRHYPGHPPFLYKERIE